jgi:arabinofuranosyltransferase
MTSKDNSDGFAERLSVAMYSRLPVVIMGIALLMMCIWYLSVDFLNDDAYISFRYADNLLNGHGLVFNPGERVEGYTNFFWTVMIAGTMAIGLEPMYASQVLGLILGLATLLLVYRFGTHVAHRTPVQAIVAPILLAFSVPFGVWTFSGLETPLFSFLALLGAFHFILEYREASRFPLSAIWFALASLTRPEGVLITVVSSFFGLWYLWFSREHLARHERQRFLLWLILFWVIYGPYFAWRYSYYGYLLPNTFYVRQPKSWTQRWSHWVRGYAYIRDFITTNGGILFLLPVLLAIPKKIDKWLYYVSALVLSWVVYLIYVGGDPKVYCRLVALMLPLVYLLIQEGAHEAVYWSSVLTSQRAVRSLSVILLMVAVIVTFDPFLVGDQAERFEHIASVINPQRVAIGNWLSQNASSDAKLAVRAAGIVPFYSGLYTIDMLGVLDTRIAHQDILDADRNTAHGKTDIRYILSQQPDYIMILKHETWDEFRAIDWSESGYVRVPLTGIAAKGPHALWQLADSQTAD